MTKHEYLAVLAKGLCDLPAGERDRFLDYYREMIEDRIEEGLAEDAAVAAIGEPDAVLRKIRREAAPQPEKPAAKRREWRTWEIVLLVLGSPLWLSLLLAAVAILFSLVVAAVSILFSLAVTLWSLVVVVYAVTLSLLVCGLFGLGYSLVLALAGAGGSLALLVLGGGLFCAGGGMLCLLACVAATRGSMYLCRLTLRGLRRLFRKRRGSI